MESRSDQQRKCIREALLATSILTMLVLVTILQPLISPTVQAQAGADSAEVAPRRAWGPFSATFGDVQIDVNRRGIAVRVEIPREFLAGVVNGENDTHFIESDIRNDYYYYSLVDESNHWSYDWNRENSTAPCFKPNFSFRDQNAPWCAEIWNYLNGTFLNFTAPRFVRFHELNAPSIAGIYNFTLFVANETNNLGYPDFVHAWNKTLFVPVSMKPNPDFIIGNIIDCQTSETIKAKGVVYAKDSTGTVVARAYVNQTTGFFNLTGLARGQPYKTYTLEASAGLFQDSTGMFRAYSLTPYTLDSQCSGPPQTVTVSASGHSNPPPSFRLKRAPQITGPIEFFPSETNDTQIHPLIGNPLLKQAGIQALNVTVEAVDTATGNVFRDQSLSHTLSSDPASDNFTIITGSRVRYVGLNPYGTEFAGLPQGGLFRLQVWVTGYSMQSIDPFQVPSQGAKKVENVRMDFGGVIWGEIRFVRDGSLTAETPHQAEQEVGANSLFGGNVIIEAKDSDQTLRGLVMINGTHPDGTTRYESQSSLLFYVVGFSEFQNRTWAGIWNERDDGLHVVDTYTLEIFVRGYEQVGPVTVQFNGGGNRYPTNPLPVYMKRGGAIAATVSSYNNRFGTRALQSPQPWRFLNLSIPVRARVYFYGPPCAQNVCGYVERLMVVGIPNGVNRTYFNVLFTGQNWSLREIWFYSHIPTHISNATYTVNAYTLGYVQQRDASTQGAPGGPPTNAYVALLIGNGVGIIGTLLIAPRTDSTKFTSIPEHDHVIAQIFSSASLSGATPGNLTTGIRTLVMPIFGFGGMNLNNTFVGLGHFSYVEPDRTQHFDYGLDVGNYTYQIPEFGFTKHFMQLPSPLSISFSDLGYYTDPSANLIAMGWASQGDTQVNTIVNPPGDVIPLSWIRVEAFNGSISDRCSPNLSGSIDRCVYTLDGSYDGVGALFLPAGNYTFILQDITNSCKSQSETKIVNWNSPTSFSGTLNCTDPPESSPTIHNEDEPLVNPLVVPTPSLEPGWQNVPTRGDWDVRTFREGKTRKTISLEYAIS